jgi:hypothetical protein
MSHPVAEDSTPTLLTAFQRLAWSTIVFSVTRRCPLSCAHCITSSTSSREFGVLPVERAQRWASELDGLAREGLRHITFTGGEPTLAIAAVAVLADAARSAGVESAIVSSGAFATSDSAAAAVVSRLGSIDRWDLGYDEYHAEWLPLDRFACAVRALRTQERPFTIRVCEGRDSDVTNRLLAELATIAGADVEIIRQPVKALGRASALMPLSERHGGSAAPTLPCVSTGPVVRDDGSVAPCCSGLAYADSTDHPFQLGDADRDGLGGIWRAWREDQLLRLMRLVGTQPVQAWLADEGIDPRVGGTSCDVCETCVATWRAPGATDAAARRAASPAVRAKLDAVEAHLFGAVWEHSVGTTR